MWRQRRWRKLLNILEQLPRTSAYAQALATDEQLARVLAELPENDRNQAPRWRRYHRDYSPEVEMLSALFDRLGELIRVTASMRGGRGGPPTQAPRPVTAVERARRRLAMENHRSLSARILRKPSG
jgi:hypothetical protein